MKTLKRSLGWMALVGLILVAMVGCTTTQKGALIGAGVGAGTGALIGHAAGEAGAGALIGAGLGATAGALAGDAYDKYEVIPRHHRYYGYDDPDYGYHGPRYYSRAY